MKSRAVPPAAIEMISRPNHRRDSAAPGYGEAIRTARRAARIVALALALGSIPRLAALQRAATPDDFPGITLCEGGRAVSRNRAYMAAIGRRGGEKSRERRAKKKAQTEKGQ